VPVKHGLLTLLQEGPAHGYQLKAEFERRTGGSWQLNIGQVYTTLQRLERDGLAAAVDTPDDDGRRPVAITPAGRDALARWYATPIVPVPPPRDELAIKVLLAVASPDVDVAEVLRRQRTALVEHLQALTRRARVADPAADLAVVLHLDALILKAEAEVRWLERCEQRLRARPSTPPTTPPPPRRGPPSAPAASGRDRDPTDRSTPDPSTDDRPATGASGARR
jgi:DNA-binding PadR family transcriptional regulator